MSGGADCEKCRRGALDNPTRRNIVNTDKNARMERPAECSLGTFEALQHRLEPQADPSRRPDSPSALCVPSSDRRSVM